MRVALVTSCKSQGSETSPSSAAPNFQSPQLSRNAYFLNPKPIPSITGPVAGAAPSNIRGSSRWPSDFDIAPVPNLGASAGLRPRIQAKHQKTQSCLAPKKTPQVWTIGSWDHRIVWGIRQGLVALLLESRSGYSEKLLKVLN